MTVEEIAIAFCASFAASLLAVIVVLWIDRQRLPRLRIRPEDASPSNRYPAGHAHAGETWRYIRLSVANEEFPSILKWIPRQAAENCRAALEVMKVGDTNAAFTMRGRWASTPEVPHVPREWQLVKTLYPDPVAIAPSASEPLDVAAQMDGEGVAYGWNNEAYFHDWRTPNYRLEPGDYDVSVTITTQNGVSYIGSFALQVDQNFERTTLYQRP